MRTIVGAQQAQRLAPGAPPFLISRVHHHPRPPFCPTQAHPQLSGIMVPMVSTAEEARRVVQMCKFPPIGIRGQGSPYTPFAQGMKTAYDYVNQYNANTMIMIQIETVQAVKNIEEIAQVEGIGESVLSTLRLQAARPSMLSLTLRLRHALCWTQRPRHVHPRLRARQRDRKALL